MFEDVREWVTVAGSGGHIRATRDILTIRKGADEERYDISKVGHLIIVGGHNVHTSAVVALVRAGTTISFFDADGRPAGQIHPSRPQDAGTIRAAQQKVSGHSIALIFAQAAINARILAIERYGNAHSWDLLYEGELEFLHRSREELPFLIRMEEVRRLHKLVADMYYEIMARTVPPELNFRRRTRRPHTDPVNAMLSFGYAIIYGSADVAISAAGLDPDLGALHEGAGGLIYDVIDGFKPAMIDETIFSRARDGIAARDYEAGDRRCYLSEDLIQNLLGSIRRTLDDGPINAVVRDYALAILSGKEFSPVY
ncbi:MAG: CRISP-associated protein Cas1 [Methanofollis sp.]|nr:CRISP-associated protein Cas1 [Methanofollis sp.]